jgi:serine/threonine protein kinase/tetratricopeptide (TPR) repeat protein
MAERWRLGERPRADDYLDRHPELRTNAEAAVRLLYEEYCLRQEQAEPGVSEEILGRFPEFRRQLTMLLECHRALEPDRVTVRFPEAGEEWGGFELLAELGRGAHGRVFLARQPALADRPVVLKFGPAGGREHLSLARLQHTYIVPLYSAQDDPTRNVRALCMPYFGGMTLAQALEELASRVPRERAGRHFNEVLDGAATSARVALPAQGPFRQFFERSTYVHAVCGIGQCLADALHYAHERGLVHLDVKPSNVLIAADGQPMLLDFHLAQEPIQPDGAAPLWLGGTRQYMSPEQENVLAAVRHGLPTPRAVDRRSDIYSLGLVLYEALGGERPRNDQESLPPLWLLNPLVTVGLSDIVARALRPEPAERYAHAGALSADLSRHLANLPLRGVRNRSFGERWRKWRRRRPHLFTLGAGLGLAFLVCVLALGYEAKTAVDRWREAGRLVQAGGERRLVQQHGAAIDEFQRAVELAERWPANEGIAARARAEGAAEELHVITDRVRFLFGVELNSGKEQRDLAAHCAALWVVRDRLLDAADAELDANLNERLREDLLDLAVLWSRLRVHLAPAKTKAQARQAALAVLDQAAALLGTSAVHERERHEIAVALGPAVPANKQTAAEHPSTAWEFYALGLGDLLANRLESAQAAFDRSVALRSDEFWTHFYRGVCSYRLKRYHDAVTDFSVCVFARPQAPECYYNRAQAYSAMGRRDRAIEDQSAALRLREDWGMAELNRGILLYQEGRYADAARDLQSALQHGADPASAEYNLALVQVAQNDRRSARTSLRRALGHDPAHVSARRLLDQLEKS